MFGDSRAKSNEPVSSHVTLRTQTCCRAKGSEYGENGQKSVIKKLGKFVDNVVIKKREFKALVSKKIMITHLNLCISSEGKGNNALGPAAEEIMRN